MLRALLANDEPLTFLRHEQSKSQAVMLFKISAQLGFSVQTIEYALMLCIQASASGVTANKYLDVIVSIDCAQKLHETLLVHIKSFCDPKIFDKVDEHRLVIASKVWS